MQRIIIDTNLLVSGIISQSYPYLVMSLVFIDDDIQLCVSAEVLEEYNQVLNRSKFSKYPGFKDSAENYLKDVNKFGALFAPMVKLNILADLNDNKFLELAASSKADFLITGNMKHFPMKIYEQTRIVTPKEYWEKYR